MNLPSDLQRLAPFLAVAVLALAGLFLVTRGLGGGGGGGSTDANAVMQRALTTSPESGVLDLTTSVGLVPAKAGAPEPRRQTLSFSGPFVAPKAEGDLGQADITVRQVRGDTTTTVRAISTGERGFVQAGGSWYELGDTQAKRVFGDTQSANGSFLGEAGIDVQKWTTNPRITGSAQVDGVDTHRIVGDLDVQALLADLGDETTAAADASTRDAAGQGQVELLVGKDDGLLRKVSVRGDLTAQGAAASIRVDAAIHNVNKPQRITAPENANPPGRIDEVATSRLGPFAADVRRPRRSAGGNSKAGENSQRGERSGKAYVNCVSQAQDAAALEKCQALVP